MNWLTRNGRVDSSSGRTGLSMGWLTRNGRVRSSSGRTGLSHGRLSGTCKAGTGELGLGFLRVQTDQAIRRLNLSRKPLSWATNNVELLAFLKLSIKI